MEPGHTEGVCQLKQAYKTPIVVNPTCKPPRGVENIYMALMTSKLSNRQSSSPPASKPPQGPGYHANEECSDHAHGLPGGLLPQWSTSFPVLSAGMETIVAQQEEQGSDQGLSVVQVSSGRGVMPDVVSLLGDMGARLTSVCARLESLEAVEQSAVVRKAWLGQVEARLAQMEGLTSRICALETRMAEHEARAASLSTHVAHLQHESGIGVNGPAIQEVWTSISNLASHMGVEVLPGGQVAPPKCGGMSGLAVRMDDLSEAVCESQIRFDLKVGRMAREAAGAHGMLQARIEALEEYLSAACTGLDGESRVDSAPAVHVEWQVLAQGVQPIVAPDYDTQVFGMGQASGPMASQGDDGSLQGDDPTCHVGGIVHVSASSVFDVKGDEGQLPLLADSNATSHEDRDMYGEGELCSVEDVHVTCGKGLQCPGLGVNSSCVSMPMYAPLSSQVMAGGPAPQSHVSVKRWPPSVSELDVSTQGVGSQADVVRVLAALAVIALQPPLFTGAGRRDRVPRRRRRAVHRHPKHGRFKAGLWCMRATAWGVNALLKSRRWVRLLSALDTAPEVLTWPRSLSYCCREVRLRVQP